MGWWVSPDGKAFNTGAHGHFEFIVTKPGLFGLKKKEVSGLTLADHRPTIDIGISKGWVRVRGSLPDVDFEVAVLDQKSVFLIKRFMQKARVDPLRKFMIEEAATGAVWYEPAAWVLTDEALKFARNPKRKPRLSIIRGRG